MTDFMVYAIVVFLTKVVSNVENVAVEEEEQNEKGGEEMQGKVERAEGEKHNGEQIGTTAIYENLTIIINIT